MYTNNKCNVRNATKELMMDCKCKSVRRLLNVCLGVSGSSENSFFFFSQQHFDQDMQIIAQMLMKVAS